MFKDYCWICKLFGYLMNSYFKTFYIQRNFLEYILNIRNILVQKIHIVLSLKSLSKIMSKNLRILFLGLFRAQLDL